jgi:hypothetical protein
LLHKKGKLLLLFRLAVVIPPLIPVDVIPVVCIPIVIPVIIIPWP